MNIHIIMHESFEAPGAILDWAEINDCKVTCTRLYQGDTFATSVDEFDYLIVMGGPQSPDTTLAESPHFDAAKEIAFIKKAIQSDKYLLGICLGAQLIGEALGAKFDHSPNREIGVFLLTLTEAGKEDPIISTFGDKFMVGHWHGDMPGLTVESKLLATSEGCHRQIVMYTPKIYGFQCHFEFTSESIEGMIVSCGHELETYKGLPYVEKADKLRANNYAPINRLLFKFLDYMKSKYDSEEK